MSSRYFKYGLSLSLPVLAFIAFSSAGWLTFLPLLEAFVLIPLLELLARPRMKNLSKNEEEVAETDRVFDYILYLVSFAHFAALIFFFFKINSSDHWFSLVGKTLSMGLLCGALGINIGHELGHRNNIFDQNLAKTLLLSSLYMHFFIEHNRGHHKNVATHHDPATARYGESLYRFWLRCVWQSYRHAWQIENRSLRKKGEKAISLKNQMLRFQLIQLALILVVYFAFGPLVLLCFICAAVFGFLMLETIDYIEHYGLSRKEISSGIYERTQPHHSWDSNFPIGRLMLFELSRHADHHYLANRKYQILRSHQNAPQMPTGYPGMMLLSLIPPIWFRVMNARIK